MGSLTDLLLLWNTHDLEGIHGLIEQILVLLAWNRDVPIGEESVVVVVLKEEFL